MKNSFSRKIARFRRPYTVLSAKSSIINTDGIHNRAHDRYLGQPAVVSQRHYGDSAHPFSLYSRNRCTVRINSLSVFPNPFFDTGPRDKCSFIGKCINLFIWVKRDRGIEITIWISMSDVVSQIDDFDKQEKLLIVAQFGSRHTDVIC